MILLPLRPIIFSRFPLKHPSSSVRSIGLVRFRLFGARTQTIVGSVRSNRLGVTRPSSVIFSRLNRVFFRFSFSSPYCLLTRFKRYPVPIRRRRRL